MSAETIRDFILTDERNLHIAAAITEAWPDMCLRVAKGFQARLQTKLLSQLDGWKSKDQERFFIDRYACFHLFKPAWVDQYSVTLQARDYGERMQFGVLRAKDRIGERPHDEEVLDAIRQIEPTAQSDGWWEACAKMRSPAKDWRSPDVLWQMHKDEAFLDNVAEQLLAVAKAAEPMIDRLTKKA